MKFPLDWHRECLKNMRANAHTARDRFEQAWEAYERLLDNIEFRQHQLDEADKLGLTEYDQDRFRVKRNKEK